MKNALLRLLGRLQLLRPTFRAYESAKALTATRATAVAPDGLPLPPPALIVRVAGEADEAWFLEGGRLAAGSIRDSLARAGRPLETLDSMLDFGCGCGRVVRHWADLGGTAVAGSDHDERAVAWCVENLPFARFEVNGLAPPLAFAGESFDLVYALSVLTHLTEELQTLWLRELRRVVRPGGFLLLTTHGESYLERLDAEERARFERGEIVVRWEEVAGTNLCTTFHPPDAVRRGLAEGLEELEFVPEGAAGNPHQDLFLFRKP